MNWTLKGQMCDTKNKNSSSQVFETNMSYISWKSSLVLLRTDSPFTHNLLSQFSCKIEGWCLKQSEGSLTFSPDSWLDR